MHNTNKTNKFMIHYKRNAPYQNIQNPMEQQLKLVV